MTLTVYVDHLDYVSMMCQGTMIMQFPVGRTRLETVSVIVCAVIMSIATVLVIRESVQALVDGLAHRKLFLHACLLVMHHAPM